MKASLPIAGIVLIFLTVVNLEDMEVYDMKKIFFVLTAVFCTGLLAAGDILDISGDIGLGYMNYSMFTTFRSSALKSQLKEGLSSALGEGNLKYDEPKSSDYYNALGLGLSVKVSYFFTNLTVGFPFRQIPTGYDPLSAKLNTAGISNKLTNSVILDWQLGGGFTLFKNRPLNIFLGAALGIGYVRTSRHLPQSFVKTVTDSHGNAVASRLNEIRSITMFGIGVDVGIKYFFTQHIGIVMDIKDTVYFLPLLNKRFYRGTDVHGRDFTYTITKGNTEDVKSLIKHSWANNFNIRLGVAFRLY